MKPLLSEENVGVIKRLAADPALYAFDFDGTLAPIVQYPKDATISKMTMGYLKQLNDIVPMAIISGRSLEDLESRFLFRPRFLVGNHGLEGIGPNSMSLEQAKITSDKWRALLDMQLFEIRRLQGVEIENKTYSIAIHYRRAPDKGDAKLAILNAISTLELPARVIAGKSVINLLPSGAPHKGVALLDIMTKEALSSALYIGDDDTDEDAFALPTEQVLSIRVGEKTDSQAEYFIKTQDDINRLLRLLIDCTRRAQRAHGRRD